MKHQKFKKPKKWNENFYWFCGVLVGDGSINYGHVRLHAIDKEFINRFRDVGIDISGITPRCSAYTLANPKWAKRYRCEFNNVGMSNYFEKVFDGKHYSKNWKIPKSICKTSKKNISAFLKGFFDSEGHVSAEGHNINCSSTNGGGLLQISHLLTKLGLDNIIHKIMYKKSYPYYILSLKSSPKIRLKFKKYVNFTIERKMDRLLFRIKNDNIILKCEWCKNKFKPSSVHALHNKKYCSKKCKGIANNTRRVKERLKRLHQKICMFCRKKFWPTRNDSRLRFCSYKCRYMYKSKTDQKQNQIKRNKIKRFCLWCKKKIYTN